MRLDDCRSSSRLYARTGADTADVTVVRLGASSGGDPTSFDLYADRGSVLVSADLVDARLADGSARGLAPRSPVRLADTPRVVGGSSSPCPMSRRTPRR